MGEQVTAGTPGALLQMRQECCGLGVSWVLEDNRRRTLMHTRFRKLTVVHDSIYVPLEELFNEFQK